MPATIGLLLCLGACVLPPELRLPSMEYDDGASSSSASSERQSSSREIAEGDIGGETPAPETLPPLVLTQRLLTGGLLEIGPASAPVTLLVFTNTSCSYCREFEQTYVQRLLTEQTGSGKLRIVTTPFALRKYPESEDAARMLLCAARQNKGHDMLKFLFENGAGKSALARGIKELSLDEKMIGLCLADAGTSAMIATQATLADALDVTLVPTFFLNGERTVGLPTYADLRGMIESALTTQP